MIGLAVLLAFLLWPGVARASEYEPASHQEGAIPASETQPFALYLPFLSHQRTSSSFILIEQAQGRGEIEEETALIYRIFATFGDARLPWRFHGDDSYVIDSDAVSEATMRFAGLSPAARATLVPFLIPPVYAGSWYDLRTNGQIAAATTAAGPVEFIDDRCKELAQGLLVPEESEHFVVWYPPFDPQFAERALRISNDLEARIYPILTQLLREPLPDTGLGCNPSDGRLDIYLVYDPIPGEATTIALVSPYPNQGCKAAPTYMLVLRAHPAETVVIAHEFMHMIQRAYNPADQCYPNWWKEATATWAMDYFENMDVQPDAQVEHNYARYYLQTAPRWLFNTGDLREYGAYLWPFYLSHYTGSYHPELIAQIYAATEAAANGNLYKVIDDSIAGGWAQRWPEFALFNPNLPPLNQYEQWDQFTKRWETDWFMAKMPAKVSLIPFWVYYLNSGQLGDFFWLADLGIFYQEIDLDSSVRLWAFANEHVGDPALKVQALLWRDGQGWTGPEDWSGRKWTVGCQDDPAERADKILLIISNANWQRLTNSTKMSSDTRFIVSDVPCAGWQGMASWQIMGESSGPDSVVNYTIRGEATPTFTLKSRKLVGDVLQLEYQPTAGVVTWTTTVEGRNAQGQITSTCTRTGTQALTADMGSLFIAENLWEDLEGDFLTRQFYAAGLALAPERCPGLDAWALIPWLQTDLRDSNLRYWPGLDIGRLHGSDSLSESGDGYSHTTTSAWDFQARGP